MDFDSSTIKMQYWNEERMLRLFLKYDINEESSLNFIKDFVSKHEISNKKTIRAYDLKLYWLDESCGRREKFHEIMKENIDFFIRPMPFVVDKKTRDCTVRLHMRSKQIYYLTPIGIIKAYELFPSNMKTQGILTQFQKMVFYAAVMSDTDCGQNRIGVV
jgi:hypothetical protein